MQSKKVNKLPHICWNVITRTKYLEIQKTISILLKNSTCDVTLYVWTFKFTLINPWSVLVITLHDTMPWGVLPLFYNASWKFCHFYMICCDLPITWNIFSNSMKIFWLKLIFTYLSQFLHNLDQLYWCGFLNGQLLSTVYSSYSVVLYHNSISTSKNLIIDSTNFTKEKMNWQSCQHISPFRCFQAEWLHILNFFFT